jgi:hypothetical protein
MNRDDVVDLVATEGEEKMNDGYKTNDYNDNDDNYQHHHDRPPVSRNGNHHNTHEDEGEINPHDEEMRRRGDDVNVNSSSHPNGSMGDNNNNNSNSHYNDTHDGSATNMALRPLFIGNLLPNYSTDQIRKLFEHPEEFQDVLPRNTNDEPPPVSIPVDRIDIKRGYCFVFFKDATSLQEKQRIESFCMSISGM